MSLFDTKGVSTSDFQKIIQDQISQYEKAFSGIKDSNVLKKYATGLDVKGLVQADLDKNKEGKAAAIASFYQSLYKVEANSYDDYISKLKELYKKMHDERVRLQNDSSASGASVRSTTKFEGEIQNLITLMERMKGLKAPQGTLEGTKNNISELTSKLSALEGEYSVLTNRSNEYAAQKKKEQEETNKQTQALEKNTAAKEKNAQTTAQPKQMEFDFTKQTTKLTEFAENVERCIGRIRTSIADLTANMGKGIDNTAFVQSLTAFTQAMQPFADLVEKLSASSGKYQEVMQQLAASSKDLLASVQQVKNVENSVNSKTTGDAQKDAAEGMRQYINNVNKLEHALMRLDNAIAQAESDKARIAKNGGETDDIQSYINNLNRLRDAILKVQQNPDILGQKWPRP